ncbi:MAG: zinc finger domain-containing protein [Desulfobaccales bacterium]
MVMHAIRKEMRNYRGFDLSVLADDWGRILKETRRILRAAIRQGGTTVSNFLNSHGEAGLFQVRLLVYGKKGEPCPGCGAPIVRLKQAGRSTFFCPECQNLLAFIHLQWFPAERRQDDGGAAILRTLIPQV